MKLELSEDKHISKLLIGLHLHEDLVTPVTETVAVSGQDRRVRERLQLPR